MEEAFLEKIIEIVNENIDSGEIDKTKLDEDLMQYGIDSMAFIQIVISLEEEFSCELADEKLIFMEMNTVNKIYHALLETL